MLPVGERASAYVPVDPPPISAWRRTHTGRATGAGDGPNSTLALRRAVIDLPGSGRGRRRNPVVTSAGLVLG